MASGTKQNVFVDEKKFAHYYKNMSYDWSFYILTNAEFDKPVAFPNSHISHKRTAYDYRVGFWLKPICTKRNGRTKEKDADVQEIDLKSKEFQDLLANLNSCFEDDNLRILEEKLIGSKKLTENEDYIVTGLGKHMIQKLAGKVQVASSRCDKACPCGTIEPKGVCPEKAPLSKGPMYIGSMQTWHGELDLCTLGVGMKAVTHGSSGDAASNMVDDDDEDEGGDLQRKRTYLQFRNAHSQAIAQTIVFGFTEFNRHRDLSRLIPTILLNHEYFIVIIYDPVDDSLMGPRFPVYFINPNIEDKTNPQRYLGIFILWIVLNYRFFFVNNVTGIDMVPCKFRKKMEKENKIREYEKLHEFAVPFEVHTDMQTNMEYPRYAYLVHGDKRKHCDSDNE